MSVDYGVKGITSKAAQDVAMAAIANLKTLKLSIPEELYAIIEENVRIPYKVVSREGEYAYEVKVSDIPKEVEVIQFIVSY